MTLLTLLSMELGAQNIDFTQNSSLGNLYIRLYGEVHYYQPISSTQYLQGQFDAKRIVTLFGYQFDRKTQFVSEIEFEHAKEVFLEQAFIKHKIAGHLSLKAGMLLIPMGIVNENHEPNNFFSVDRSIIDKNLIPSTWRDIGIGVTGILPSADLKYQAYLVNGLLGYKDGKGLFNSTNSYRSGRQKGSKTILSTLPALSLQAEYFGFSSGKIGLSFYAGESNTDLKTGILKSDQESISVADSSTVVTLMTGLHAKFNINNWDIKSQLIISSNSNTTAYNQKSNSDLGATALGFYVEVGKPIDKNSKWIVFGRYAYLDNVLRDLTQTDFNYGLTQVYTTGLNYMAAQGAVFKIDGQWSHSAGSTNFQINSGIGIWF